MLKPQCAPCQQRITQRQHPVRLSRHRRQLRPRPASAVFELLGAAVVAAGEAGIPPAAVAAVHLHPPVLAAATAAAAVQPAPEDALVSAAAWFAVAAFSMAALGAMVRAFFEAKSAIDRRVEGSQLKEQEEEARKQKVKDMFDRL